MRPEEVLEFDAAEYARRAAGHTTSHLQEQEVIKLRQTVKSDSEVAVGTVNAILTGGLSSIQPLYSGRQGYIAEEKLKLIQAELSKRGVQLHEPNDSDDDAAAMGILAGNVGGNEVGDELVPEDEGALPNVMAQIVAGQVAEQGAAEINDAAPLSASSSSGNCSRTKLPKWYPLRCNGCAKCFDSSIMTYLHCCSCFDDNFDVCDSCASAPTASLAHVKGHVLHQIQPSKTRQPRVHSSIRGALGDKIICNECNVRLKDVDMYTCEDCLGEYDICLSCYASGKTRCSRHTSDILQRKHV